MTSSIGAARKSYLKTTSAGLALVAVAVVFASGSLYSIGGPVGALLAGIGAVIAAAAAFVASAGAIVLARYKRSVRGGKDLFLELNRMREPTVIRAMRPPGPARARRWIVKRLCGHDLLVGDIVEVKPWAEIRSTLDDRGCLGELPYMPEMLGMCGRRARVFRSMHRLFDYKKSRRMRHMDGAVLLVGAVCNGSAHGACEAACHTVWKAEWLRRVPAGERLAGGLDFADSRKATHGPPPPDFGTRGPGFACQLTQLHAASLPISDRSVLRSLMPLVSGNVAPAALLVGWLTYLFNEVQHVRGGVGFPAITAADRAGGGHADPAVAAGDHVVVRSLPEILATLNDRLMHKGLWFEPDMSKHCGRLCTVQGEVRNLIDIVTGEMLTMKTPAYILQDVHFSGERQLFNAQYEPLFWRAAWLKPARERDPGAPPLDGSAGIESVRVPPH